MRNNQPVTQTEFDYADDATLMSVTDTQSHVTYANAAFVAVSGYTREELLGQPHNIVRHPDMPAEAFADMWKTLQGGESWSALVKNRRKSGEHYWVRANAAPVHRNKQLVGYLSVRTKPTRAEVWNARKPVTDEQRKSLAELREAKLGPNRTVADAVRDQQITLEAALRPGAGGRSTPAPGSGQSALETLSKHELASLERHSIEGALEQRGFLCYQELSLIHI